MPQQRFRETSESFFFGALIYDRVVPANHFLRVLKGMVEWEGVSRQLLGYLTAIVMNLKRIVKVVAGVGFRPQGVMGIPKAGHMQSPAEAQVNYAQREGMR